MKYHWTWCLFAIKAMYLYGGPFCCWHQIKKELFDLHTGCLTSLQPSPALGVFWMQYILSRVFKYFRFQNKQYCPEPQVLPLWPNSWDLVLKTSLLAQHCPWIASRAKGWSRITETSFCLKGNATQTAQAQSRWTVMDTQSRWTVKDTPLWLKATQKIKEQLSCCVFRCYLLILPGLL